MSYYTFIIPAVITQTFNLFTELIIPTGVLPSETKVEMETYPVIGET